jgi:hypothetical protein
VNEVVSVEDKGHCDFLPGREHTERSFSGGDHPRHPLDVRDRLHISIFVRHCDCSEWMLHSIVAATEATLGCRALADTSGALQFIVVGAFQ